ncbi:MAG: cyclopropane-fatty-acyl-phospholipid synthase family protein [Caulobacteraceae bacterium]
MASRIGFLWRTTVLDGFLRRFIKVGRLRVVVGNGRARAYGDGSGPELAVRMTVAAAVKIALKPDLNLGECYMDGGIVLEIGDVYDLLDLLGRNVALTGPNRSPLRAAWFALLRRVQSMNSRRRARGNVAHHYDLSYDLYRRFLDADMQYSCAYFARPEMTLDQAQAAKKAHIAAKLLLEPTHSILDIGCGWGGLGLTLGEHVPRGKVLGVTLSEEQLAVARRRAAERRHDDQVGFELCDYRDVAGPFDRIVSVGMFEHVGVPHYQAFFDHIARLLTDDGVAVIHSIGRRSPPGITQPFIAKYIFPGGYIPALSEVLPAIERAGLWVTDVEILRLHYAETLKAWRARFAEQRAEIAEIYDERFCRMWEFYLAISEIAFRWLGYMIFQVQLTKRIDAAPMTRDYISIAEAPSVRARKWRTSGAPRERACVAQ